jgi:AraC-like DNA-binding protein
VDLWAILTIHMDSFSIHLWASPRRFPHTAQVASIGWAPRKRGIISHPFETWNLSFILKGRGIYTWRGQRFEVAAPAVLTQVPGEAMYYGPDTTWDELFVIWPPEAGPALQAVGFIDDERPWWPVTDARSLRRPIEELFTIVRSGTQHSEPDRLDRICERLALESLVDLAQPEGGIAGIVALVRRTVEEHPEQEHDIHALARRHGCSPTQFRRVWNRVVGMPPAKYVIRLRMRRAANELVESDRSIGDIAASVGYPDQLHFARRFKAFAGCTASEYRQRHRLTPGLHRLI